MFFYYTVKCEISRIFANSKQSRVKTKARLRQEHPAKKSSPEMASPVKAEKTGEFFAGRRFSPCILP